MAEEKKMNGLRARLDYVLKHNNFLYRIFNVSVSTFMKILIVAKSTAERTALCRIKIKHSFAAV